MKSPIQVLLLSSVAWGALPAQAAEIDFSGYGTVGYAVSDQPYTYQRYIDDKGTLARDSVFAVQMDARLAPRWSATVQLKLAPDEGKDNRWASTVAWGFVSWRPDNDWLLRVGKLRIPIYLNAESVDVGTSFDYARLPIEMYSLAPTLDFNGISVAKTWDMNQGELSLDAYWGNTRTKWRQYVREGVPGFFGAGPVFESIDVTARGLALTYREDSDIYRIGLHKASAQRSNGQNWVDRPVIVNPVPGVGYYTLLPGPGVPESGAMDIVIANAGVDVGVGKGVRLAAEYAIRKSTDVERGLNSSGGYMALRKPIGKWTPYVYYAQLRSEGRMLDLYQSVNKNTVPVWVPSSGLINASQRVIADALTAFDQHSWALGTSYALTPGSKLKAEWLRTRIGTVSSLVDAPPGSDVSHQDINVLSFSYSFVF